MSVIQWLATRDDRKYAINLLAGAACMGELGWIASFLLCHLLMNSTLSGACSAGNIILIVFTKMSASVLRDYLLSISPSKRNSIFVAALDSCGLDSYIDNSRLLLLDDYMVRSCLDARLQYALIAYVLAHKISKAIFFDFSEDFRVLASAKALVEIPIEISVLPVIPAPMHRLSLFQCSFLLASAPRIGLKWLLLKILGYPVRLYRFGRGNDLLTHAYLRLDNKHIDFQPFEYLKIPTPSLKLPKHIKYLYIEGCESTLSSKGQSQLICLLAFVSDIVKSRGHTLYIKPRLRNSIYNLNCKPGSAELFSSVSCEDIDMSSAILLTIGSCGALLKYMCKVISFAHLLLKIRRPYSDRYIIQNQVDYVSSFNHPLLLQPLTMHELERQILAA